MTDIQAAIGLVQLGKLGQLVARRRELAGRYQQLLSGIAGLRMTGDPGYGTTNYQSFWMLLPDESPVSRDELLRGLAHAGVSARRGIMAAHREPAYQDHPRATLPVTERLTSDSLILPLFHDLTEAQQDVVVSAVRACLSRPGPAPRPAAAATA
jgi:perosamine synthetase